MTRLWFSADLHLGHARVTEMRGYATPCRDWRWLNRWMMWKRVKS
jgi:calcineurin-like phosphoesterase family protein